MVMLLNIHYLIAKKWSVQNRTSRMGSAAPVIQHAMSRMNYVLLHIFMAHEEAHKITKLRDLMGVGACSSAFGYLYENIVYTCTTAQSHHILPCDSTLMTPKEVKTNSMMVHVAPVMVSY